MNEEHRRERTGWIPWVIIALIAAGVGVRFALPSIGAFSAKNRSHCVKNMKLLGIALHNYHDHWGAFPPAYFADADGKPMHSWRIILLPYYESPESKALASQYDFKQP